MGADVKGDKVCIHGWKTVTDTTIFDLAQIYSPHLKYLMCTDIARDGMLQGPSLDLYRHILEHLPGIRLIASGGVSGEQDMEELDRLGVPEVIVGKAIYEGRITLERLVQYQTNKE